MRLRSIEIVEDRTSEARGDTGFLVLSRLRLRNEYADGSRSRVYDCDLMSRPESDAVAALLYRVDDRRRVRVLLRDSIRPPVFLRLHKRFVHPDPRIYSSLREIVAGLVEPSDAEGPSGLCARAAAEAHEEAGLKVPAASFEVVGETFASPGVSDEKVYFCAASADVDAARAGAGDGSVMEEAGAIAVLELSEAIEACRSGAIPDMKTELGLLRLADHLGFIPQLDCFADELPLELRSRHRRLGITAARDK